MNDSTFVHKHRKDPASITKEEAQRHIEQRTANAKVVVVPTEQTSGGIPGAMQVNEDDRMADHLVTAKKDGYQRWERSPEGQEATRRREQIEQLVRNKVSDAVKPLIARIERIERQNLSLQRALGDRRLVVTGEPCRNIEYCGVNGKFVAEGDEY